MPELSEYTSIAERLVQSLSKVSEYKMRSSVFFKKLCILSDEGIIEVLNIILNKANKERGTNSDIIDIFFDQSAIEENIGKKRIDILLSLAVERGYEGVVDLIGNSSISNNEIDIKEERVYDFDERTIGERKSYASSYDPDLIAKLIHDPEPMVIERLLQNPRITERDVLKIITRRPVKSTIIRVVSNSIRWNSSYTIRDAIVRNPYTPPQIALKILPSIMKQDLEEILQDGSLSELIRNRAKDLLYKKRMTTDEFFAIDQSEETRKKNL